MKVLEHPVLPDYGRKGRAMIQGHDRAAGLKQFLTKRERASLLRIKYPLLFPLFLLGCALITGYAAIAGTNVFPVLTLIGVSTIPLCLSIALITGISGILTSIIGIIEVIDRQSFRAAMFPKQKEQKPC
jgi:hypothetical protein